MFWNRTVRVTAVFAGTIGGVTSAVYGVLNRQSKYAQRVIGEPEAPPPVADGRYAPPGWTGPADADALRFAVIGDSLAAGLGAETAAGLPGVLLAKGLAETLGQPVDLTTYAIVGATTKDMIAQVDEAVATPPDVVLIVIGGNDVTTKMSIGASATLLGAEVARLRAIGAGVVVGTCPDLLPIRPLRIPLRWVASGWSRLLARAQDRSVRKAGGLPVALGEQVSPEFLLRPEIVQLGPFPPERGRLFDRQARAPGAAGARGRWRRGGGTGAGAGHAHGSADRPGRARRPS